MPDRSFLDTANGRVTVGEHRQMPMLAPVDVFVSRVVDHGIGEPEYVWISVPNLGGGSGFPALASEVATWPLRFRLTWPGDDHRITTEFIDELVVTFTEPVVIVGDDRAGDSNPSAIMGLITAVDRVDTALWGTVRWANRQNETPIGIREYGLTIEVIRGEGQKAMIERGLPRLAKPAGPALGLEDLAARFGTERRKPAPRLGVVVEGASKHPETLVLSLPDGTEILRLEAAPVGDQGPAVAAYVEKERTGSPARIGEAIGKWREALLGAALPPPSEAEVEWVEKWADGDDLFPGNDGYVAHQMRKRAEMGAKIGQGHVNQVRDGADVRRAEGERGPGGDCPHVARDLLGHDRQDRGRRADHEVQSRSPERVRLPRDEDAGRRGGDAAGHVDLAAEAVTEAPLDVEGIRGRYERARRWPEPGTLGATQQGKRDHLALVMQSLADVPVLLGEVERLCADLAQSKRILEMRESDARAAGDRWREEVAWAEAQLNEARAEVASLKQRVDQLSRDEREACLAEVRHEMAEVVSRGGSLEAERALRAVETRIKARGER